MDRPNNPTSKAKVASARDPWRAVLTLGSRRWRAGLATGLAGALLVHGAAAGRGAQLHDLLQVRAFSAAVQRSVSERMRRILEVELEQKKPEPEPEPEPEVEPEPEPEAEPEPPPPPPKAEAPSPTPEAAPEPPPPPAEAGKVLTAEPDPDEPLDLTGDVGFVTGTGERYVGGVTASAGTGKKAVYNRAASPEGVPGGKGKAPAPRRPPIPPGPDLSRSVKAAPGNRLASCPWPPEADIEQINFMRVTVVVTTDPSGKPTAANVPNDPGHGFGRAARRCVLRERFSPALDRGGNAISSSAAVSLTFKR